MEKQDYYEILGVRKEADETEIKKAYRKLAKKYHPDANPGDQKAEQIFKDITEAYDVLGNPEKKKLYDMYGMAAFDGSMNSNYGESDNSFHHGDFSSGFGGNNPYYEYHCSYNNVNDVDMDKIFRNYFEDLFGSSWRNRARRDRFQYGYQEQSSLNLDIHTEIFLSLEEAALGCDKILYLKGVREERLQVHIPAGINEGQSIRLKGKGNSDPYGNTPGDLFVKVHIHKNPVYQRKGMDVYTTISVPYETAREGGEIYVQTLYGAVLCRIPAGIRSGGKIRLKNKGIVSMKNAGIHGDEYVTIQIRNSFERSTQ